jgi:methionine-rich copper-binding protein CopC
MNDLGICVFSSRVPRETSISFMRVDVPALPTGAYSVTWAAGGGDGHRRKGDFKFPVK